MEVENITTADEARSYVATCVDMMGMSHTCEGVEEALGVESGMVTIDHDGHVYVDGSPVEDEQMIEVAGKI